MSSSWPIEINGLEYQPIPESWIEHGDEGGIAGKRLFAVSAALTPNGRMLRIRYGHPRSGQVLLAQHGAAENPRGDGIVPEGLVRGTGWVRSKTPSPDIDPVEPLRDPEWQHFEELWGDRLQVDVGPVDRGSGTIADGGVTIDDGAKFTGVDPEEHLAELEYILQTFSANPLKSTFSSKDVADALDLRKNQATAILNKAEQKGLVERWSAEKQAGNPKWLVKNGGESA